jgi:ABC-type lipoprotein export system ATPase subunit
MAVTHDTDFVAFTDAVVSMRDGHLSDPVTPTVAAGQPS